MEQEFNYVLVFASIGVAFLTSFLAIAFASHIIWDERYKSCLWTYGAAVNMGMGMWTMHFIGMMAMHIGTPIQFDTIQTIISAAFAVVGSYVAFKTLLDPQNLDRLEPKFLAAFALGTSIIAMHYVGMNAMQMFPQPSYDLFWVSISVIIAYSASYIGLELFISASNKPKNSIFNGQNLLSAVVIGLAIAAMHYSGMIAVEFAEESFCTVRRGIDSDTMAYYIVGVILLILSTSLLFLLYQQHLSRKQHT